MLTKLGVSYIDLQRFCKFLRRSSMFIQLTKDILIYEYNVYNVVRKVMEDYRQQGFAGELSEYPYITGSDCNFITHLVCAGFIKQNIYVR